MSSDVEQVPLHRATSDRYLSYALSVITSRALPDVRDGLKPVQRRILYTMYAHMNLLPTGRYRKCAEVVGEVMGKHHPHGNDAIYEALVRMAQDFSLRSPLVDGQGNFGSLDGDPPAAMRYTECRLRPLAEELLSEIRKDVVDFRPNYDGQRLEPVVLPAQVPQLLVNGCEGIAVGMATRIPPHNLGEIVDATIALVDDRDLEVVDLLRMVRGPDFPTGGELIASAEEVRSVYETGQGSLKVRATWMIEQDGRRNHVVITSIPYGQNKAKLVEAIGEFVRTKKLPQVVDVRDESTDVVRVVLDLKSDANAENVMAFLFKRTGLQSTFPVNMTALVPGVRAASGGAEGLPPTPVPERLDLKQVLVHWLDFRFDTLRRRYAFDLAELRSRIHVLEGFAKVFDVLDEILRLIRASEGKKDAAEKIIAAFGLSELQTDAILELKLYRLAKLEINLVVEELDDKRAAAERIEKLLANDKKLWNEVKRELREIRKHYADERRTIIALDAPELVFNEDVFIADEDAYVIVSRDGWIKRQSSFNGVSKIRMREGDEIGWLMLGNTRTMVTVFTSLGVAYTVRVDAVPATSGYGEPLQTLFSFADGERVIGVVSHDLRHNLPTEAAPGDDPPPPHLVAVTVRGRGLRAALAAFGEPSNRTGRKFARLDEGDTIFAAMPIVRGAHWLCLATRKGRALVQPPSGLPVLKAAGKGVAAIKLTEGDQVMACELSDDHETGPVVTTALGRTVVVCESIMGEGTRGELGTVVLKKGTIDQWVRTMVLELGPTAAPEASQPAASKADDAEGET